MRFLLIFLIKIYQRFISPLKPIQGCKFAPTCSQYMLEAIQIHGSVKGTFLGLRRLSQCHPNSKYSGYDPVPPRKKRHR